MSVLYKDFLCPDCKFQPFSNDNYKAVLLAKHYHKFSCQLIFKSYNCPTHIVAYMFEVEIEVKKAHVLGICFWFGYILGMGISTILVFDYFNRIKTIS